MQEMKKEFENEEGVKEFVERNMQRMERNKILRKMRLARKLNLNQWNWFCTVTYFYGHFLSSIATPPNSIFRFKRVLTGTAIIF